MLGIGWELGLIGICLVFSALFSAAETALVALTGARLEQLLEQKPRISRPLRLWKQHPHEVLTTILIGNNVVNITASALAAGLAARLFPQQGIPIAIGIMTFLVLLSGEIFPKTLARMFAPTLAPPIMAVVGLFHMLIYPISWCLARSIQFLLRLGGGPEASHARVTEEDIAYTIALGGKDGGLTAEKRHLLESVLRFTDTSAREVMKPRIEMISLSIDDDYQQARQACSRSGYSRLPVQRDSLDTIVGMFYAKSLLTPPTNPTDAQNFVRSRLQPPVYVPESQKISEVLKIFQRNRMHIAIVVDEFGGTSGLLTLEDIVEELLGEIRDEFDREEEKLTALSPGVFLADARLSIGDVEERLQVHFAEERAYESLGGFLLEQAGEVPRHGWECTHAGWRFCVEESTAQRVITVRIEALPEATEQTPPQEQAASERAGSAFPEPS